VEAVRRLTTHKSVVNTAHRALWGHIVRSFLTVIASAALLAGCAHQQQQYLRTDGAPLNNAQAQATLAQCKGEGATTVAGEGGGLLTRLERDRKEKVVIDACMARNGYILPQ
jgi:hypothetical protein